MSIAERISPLVGRLLFVWYFGAQAIGWSDDWAASVAYFTLKGVPAPSVLLALVIVIQVLGAISLLLGFRAKQGALMLFAFEIAAAMMFHDYWTLTGGAREATFELFARNLAIAGGLLMIVGLGAGPFAMDNANKRR